MPVRATAFGAAPAPCAPRARADAHSHRTLATRTAPNLRHLAGRKARPRRRAALDLIHRHRHHHHPFAAACAHGCSLRWPPEPTASGTRARRASSWRYVDQRPRSALPRRNVRSAGEGPLAIPRCGRGSAQSARAEPRSDRPRRPRRSRCPGHPLPGADRPRRAVLSRFEPELATDDWGEDLRRFARAHRHLLARHPWTVAPLFTQPNPERGFRRTCVRLQVSSPRYRRLVRQEANGSAARS